MKSGASISQTSRRALYGGATSGDQSRYVILGTDRYAEKSWITEVSGTSIWYHPDRAIEALSDLMLRQRDPHVRYIIFQEVNRYIED